MTHFITEGIKSLIHRKDSKMLANLFIKLGWSRDDAKWLWAEIITVAGLISSNVFDVPYWMAYLHIPLSPTALHWIFAICALVLYVAGKHDSSPLPSAAQAEMAKPINPPKIVMLLPLLLIAGLTIHCGISIKQLMVVSLQASETALETSHDMERALCFTSPSTESGGHCTNPLAATAHLTDDKHQKLADFYVTAFSKEIAAAGELKTWTSGPVPATLAGYRGVLDNILNLAQTIDNSPLLVQIQTAVGQSAKALGGQ